MNRDRTMSVLPTMPRRFGTKTPYVAGAILGLGIIAGWVAVQASRRPHRRYADRAQDRRSPMSLFIAGDHPRRREIDRSGAHPLFERREEVYDAY